MYESDYLPYITKTDTCTSKLPKTNGQTSYELVETKESLLCINCYRTSQLLYITVCTTVTKMKTWKKVIRIEAIIHDKRLVAGSVLRWMTAGPWPAHRNADREVIFCQTEGPFTSEIIGPFRSKSRIQ